MSNSFSMDIAVDVSPEVVVRAIIDVPKWWTKDFEGSNGQAGDEFVICHPGSHYSKQRVVEIIPGKKVVWLVTESALDWLAGDKHEWTDTKMVFEIVGKDRMTEVHFTHEGLVPEKECYARCAEGWTLVVKEQLFRYITEGVAI